MDKISNRAQWIEQHDAIGKKANELVILEEYGTPFPDNTPPLRHLGKLLFSKVA